jgi:hypothetical protein
VITGKARNADKQIIRIKWLKKKEGQLKMFSGKMGRGSTTAILLLFLEKRVYTWKEYGYDCII